MLAGLFLIFYFLPLANDGFVRALLSGFALLNEYARQHVLTCLVPAFFIAGAIAVFVRQGAILKYLGANTHKVVSYGVAAVSGTILAVCSCTILPMFASVRRRGAGLGPAVTLLFSGPAINIAAIFLTFSVLGVKIGSARAIAAIGLSILVGLSMHLIFREKSGNAQLVTPDEQVPSIPKWRSVTFFGSLIGILMVNGLQIALSVKYSLMGLLGLAVIIVALRFQKDIRKQWLSETWSFTKMLLPLLFFGVFIAGFIMPYLPQELIKGVVGSNSVVGNLVASVFGAFMYFSTLTEIPILQALIAKGMNQGPALALLLAGPSLSLPNMLVVRKVLGTAKTAVYVALVIVYSTAGGLLFGGLS